MYNENHAHIILNGKNYKSAIEKHKNGIDEFDIREKLNNYAKSGVSFIRDGGDNLGVGVYAKNLANEYGVEYITPAFAIYKKGNYGSILGKGFGDMSEYKALLYEAKKLNADFIKIMASGILDFSTFGKVSSGELSYEELSEMVNIAHSEGFAVMVHVNKDENIKNALISGADSIEHGFYITKDTLDIMKETDSVWVPTLAACKNLMRNDAYRVSAVGKICAYHEEMIKYAFSKGVNVALGSDSGAYMVEHTAGIYDECGYVKEVIGNDILFDETVRRSQEIIVKKFKEHLI